METSQTPLQSTYRLLSLSSALGPLPIYTSPHKGYLPRGAALFLSSGLPRLVFLVLIPSWCLFCICLLLLSIVSSLSLFISLLLASCATARTISRYLPLLHSLSHVFRLARTRPIHDCRLRIADCRLQAVACLVHSNHSKVKGSRWRYRGQPDRGLT